MMTFESTLLIGCAVSVGLALTGAVISQMRYSLAVPWAKRSMSGGLTQQETHTEWEAFAAKLLTMERLAEVRLDQPTVNLLLQQLERDRELVERNIELMERDQAVIRRIVEAASKWAEAEPRATAR